MTTSIRCTTLFDITATGVGQRRTPPNNYTNEQLQRWHLQCRQQANYDTILQVINLRSQPEVIIQPHKIAADLTQWNHESWCFEFLVQHPSVFSDGTDELGALLKDCADVPMITGLTETVTLKQFLESPDNIIFEIVPHEEYQQN